MLRLALAVVGALITGCLPLPADTDHRQTGGISAPVRPNETIAILTIPSSANNTEEASQCLGEAIRRTHPGTRIITSNEFRRSVFSYGVPKEKTKRTEYMQSLMNHPLLKERITAMGIRLIFLLLDSETVGSEPYSGGGGPGPGFIAWWGRHWTSTIEVAVFELGRPGEAGELAISAKGKTTVILMGIFPMVITSSTETGACDELFTAVSKFLGVGEQQTGASSK